MPLMYVCTVTIAHRAKCCSIVYIGGGGGGGGGGVFLSLLLLLGMTYAQEILQAPESTVVFLDQSAVFTCETVGDAATWRVNGILLRRLPPEIRSDLVDSETNTDEGTVMEELTIPGRAQYNGTRVQCLVGELGGSSDESENATLMIQGPPSAVVDLKATSNSTSITISWEAPWSLDVTGVDPDIWYSVLIQNVTDENNPTPISCTDCTNITETVYTFTPDHLSPCHVYNFSVTPFNGAGQGESRATEHQGISFERKNITYIGGGTCSVTFKLVCGDSDMINGVTLYYGSNEKAASSISGGEVVSQLPADREYNTTLRVELAQGGMQNVSTHIFTTFDVQDPQAESHANNRIGVEGTLIYNSRATGCFLAIQCNITTQITFIALKRDETNRTLSEVIEVPPSNYTVYAHDLEEDGLPNPRPANLHPDSLQPITVNGRGDYPKNANPSNASISHTGSVVTIKCTPEEGSSCVVVYRAYGNSTLNIYNKEFPVNITVDQSGVNYTFAIFRNTSIDERPFFSEMISVSPPPSTSQPTEPTEPTGNGASPSSDVTGVVVGIAVTIILTATGTGIIVVVVVMWRQKKTRSRKPCPPSAVAPTERGDVESGCGDQNGGSSEGGRSDTLLIGDQLAEDGSATQAKEEEGKYAVVVTSSSGNRFPPCVDPTAVVYSELNIRATHKMARFDYADVTPSTANRPAIDVAKTEFPYVDVKLPNPTTTVTSPSAGFEEKAMEKTAEEKAKFQGPPTVEAVMSLIYCVAGRWKMIASGLGFDENLIDEIYTNNETDEACLQDCVEQWVSRLEPSWERLSLVLRDLGEESLAQLAWNGVSAEEGAEWSKCSESHEVVTGTRGDTPFSDTRNDETRGKIHSFGHFIVPFGDSTIREDQRKQEHTQSEDMGGGHQNSSPAPHTAKDPERNVSAGVEVAPQQCSCVTPFPVQMEQDRATDGPFQHESKGVERNMFPDARKHFSLDLQCERGTLLVGGKCNYTSCEEPLSAGPQYLPFPGELPPEPTPPQEPAQVAVEETGENSHPPTQPPTLPPSSRMEVGGTTQTKNNTLPFLDPPEGESRQVAVHWRSPGLGFHGPGSLFKLLLELTNLVNS